MKTKMLNWLKNFDWTIFSIALVIVLCLGAPKAVDFTLNNNSHFVAQRSEILSNAHCNGAQVSIETVAVYPAIQKVNCGRFEKEMSNEIYIRAALKQNGTDIFPSIQAISLTGVEGV